MKIIFDKYGGIKDIQDRKLLVQSSIGSNFVDIYYQDEEGNFADPDINLATIAFKRADTFETSERTCALVKEELTNNPLYFRYILKEDELAINGELQMTVRLKQVVFDPEDDSKVLLIKQRAMGKITAHIYEAIGGNYENFDVVDGRILQLELWQANFESDYYNADQIDAKLVLERQATNDSLDDHNTSNEAHEYIRQSIENLDNTIQEQIDTINGTLSEHDFRINELEDFASNLEIDIDEGIEQAISNHNTSETAHSDIRQKVDEAKAIAEGKSRARVFATKSALDTWLLDSENVALLQIGDNFYIEEIDKPNYWWNGTTIKELETQKVDLTEYAKKTELLTLGTTSNDAYRGDLGQTAYEHSQSTHAPSNAQKNSDITKAEIEAKLTGTITTHNHNTDYYTKDDIDTMIGDIPALKPTIELEVASLTTLTEAEKLAIRNTLNTLIVNDKIDGTKFDDIVLVTTNDLIRLHYSSIDYYVANPQITVIFETVSTKYILHVPLIDYIYSTLTSTTTTIPTISTSITTDATDDTKTASPKAVKTYVDNVLGDIETLLGAL